MFLDYSQILVREGLKNKKNKKYGIFHNRAGGSTPFHTFFYLFSDSKVTIFSKIWGFLAAKTQLNKS